MSAPLPLVSVLVVVRNAADSIGSCLDRLIEQDYPADRMEIVVVDGMSEDGTREVAGRYAAERERILLIDNQPGTYSAGLNAGIRASNGDYVIKVDGHTMVRPEFVRLSVEAALSSGAAVSGGRIETTGGSTLVSRAIALVLASRFGIGNSRFRHGDARAGWADTVPYGCYARGAFEEVGLFDENRVRTEDLDLHRRILDAGMRIYYDPRIVSTYLSRRTVAGMCRQAFDNGAEMPSALRSVRPRHVVPFVFVLALIAGLVALLFGNGWPLAVILGAYLAADAVASLQIAWHHGWHYLLAVPWLFPALHLSYGTGTLYGFLGVRGRIPSSTSAPERGT